MSWQKINAHIWMWILIGLGALVAFLFFPYSIIITNSIFLFLLLILLAFILVYNLISSAILHHKLSRKMRKEEKLIESGIYGRFSHPTCITLAIIFWIFFLFIPDIRIFVSNVWMTFVLIFWIKTEKSAFRKNNKKPKIEEVNI